MQTLLSMKRIIIIVFLIFVLIGGVYFIWKNNADFRVNFLKKAELPLESLNSKKGKQEGLKCEDCNLIIISLTNTRKDHIGLYGYDRDTTPNIDNFFSNSLIFENAFSPSSWTLPNAFSMMTSLYPYSHKITSRYETKPISRDHNNIAEILSSNKYKTAAFTGGGDYSKIYGFDRGFNEYFSEKNFSSIIENKDDIISWLNKNEKEKFFLFLQGFDTHCPFNPIQPYINKFKSVDSQLDSSVCYWNTSEDTVMAQDGKTEYSVYKQEKGTEKPPVVSLKENDRQKLVDLYDGRLNQADDALGQIFEVIKKNNLDKNTIFIFLSEHGDLIGENGRFMRTDILGTFNDKVLNIPFIIKHPFIKDKKIDGIVNLVDLAPTILNLLEIENNYEMFEGKNITPLIQSKEIINEYAYGGLYYEGSEESLFFNDIREVNTIRSLNYKLIEEQIFDLEGNLLNEKYKLHDIKKDSLEINDLSEDGNIKEIFNKLKEKLKNWRSSYE